MERNPFTRKPGYFVFCDWLERWVGFLLWCSRVCGLSQCRFDPQPVPWGKGSSIAATAGLNWGWGLTLGPGTPYAAGQPKKKKKSAKWIFFIVKRTMSIPSWTYWGPPIFPWAGPEPLYCHMVREAGLWDKGTHLQWNYRDQVTSDFSEEILPSQQLTNYSTWNFKIKSVHMVFIPLVHKVHLKIYF